MFDYNVRRTLSHNLYRAPLSAAPSTPRGLQLNLYFSGTPSACSGAGNPPQNDVNEVTRLFCACKFDSIAIAEQ